ncbi:MAG: outer membrane protein transport protein, partial [Pseudomonadota bacterium]|nr:outer membrane protein transport protein [Pseudomonadota bacterium]
MMMIPKKQVLVLAVAASMVLPSVAMATNGYFSHGFGVKSKGMAGAGLAMPLDAMDATINPANMVNVGSRIDAGVTWFSPRRSYTVDQVGPFLGPQTGAFSLIPGTFDSDNENFLIPNFGWNHMIDDVSSIGITLAGNGGMNSEYPNVTAPGAPTGTYYAGTAGVDLMQLATMVTYARQVSDQVSLGVSGIYALARFKATGLASFGRMSTDPAHLSDNGYDTAGGFGVKVGITGDINEAFSLAASYQSKINMGEFEEYAGLFAEGGDFDIPQTWSLGARFSPSKEHTILLDYQRIDYSDAAAISNPMMPNLGMCMGGDPTSCMGGSNGPGFGWEDTNIIKLGYQYDAGTWQARAGYSHNDQPVPDSETVFNILAPGVVEDHWTAGFSTNVGKSSSLDFSFMWAPETEVSGGNPLAATPGGDTQ